jgi:arylsulfatase A-like enzyme
MNILYFHSHDTGRWIAPYGHPHPTPNFSRLAEAGTLFENAFTVSPTCSPSRAALLTGQRPRKNGMIGLVHRGARLLDPQRHLAAQLRTHGYRTALSGVQHVFPGNDLANLPYDEVLASPGIDDVATADPAIASAAAAYIRRRHDKPFFLSCGLFSTHRTAGHTDQRFNAKASPLGDPESTAVPESVLDVPEARSDVADFNVSLDRLDVCLGTVLDAVDEAGVRDQTLVICTTDHGAPFPDHKGTLTDQGTGVLLILRGPGVPPGRRIPAMVSQMDLLPTIFEMIGAEPPSKLDGQSLHPLLDGSTPRLHEHLFLETNYHSAYEPQRAVRSETHLLVHRYGPHAERRVLPNCDPGPTRRAMIEQGWGRAPRPRRALFDLRHRPRDQPNLIGEPEASAVERSLSDRLHRFMTDTHDPLLQQGRVPPLNHTVMMTTPADANYPGDPAVGA